MSCITDFRGSFLENNVGLGSSPMSAMLLNSHSNPEENKTRTTSRKERLGGLIPAKILPPVKIDSPYSG